MIGVVRMIARNPQISGENRCVSAGITLRAQDLITHKTTINGDIRRQNESIGADFARQISSFRNPNFLKIGFRLKEMGAGAMVLGCAGFSPRRAALEKELGIAVIDPVQAAVAMALGAVMP